VCQKVRKRLRHGAGGWDGPLALLWLFSVILGRCPRLVWRCAVGALECGEVWGCWWALPQAGMEMRRWRVRMWGGMGMLVGVAPGWYGDAPLAR
jgi:hypothetical protein